MLRPIMGCCIVTDMTSTPPPDEPIRPGAARDAIMAAIAPGPHVDHGPVTAALLAACPFLGVMLLVWVFSAPVDGFMTPTLGYLVGAVTVALSRLIYLVGRGRI